jgi:alkaline phosphatase D
MDRRKFISSLAFVSGGLILKPEALHAAENYSNKFGLSMLQGFTDETTTQFSIDVPKLMKVHYEVLDPANGKVFYPVKIESNTKLISSHRVEKIIFKDLYLNAGFQLIVRNAKNEIFDVRDFKTLDTQIKDARVAFLSCMLDLSPHKGPMWDIVNKADPDMLFLMGDVVYGDVYGKIYGKNMLWMRYLETRRAVPLYRRRKLIPSIAIWDDHDFGKNDTGGVFKNKSDSLKTFKCFYAQEPITKAYSVGPGVASSFEGFGQKFIFLDNRYWRGLNNSKGERGFFGDDQMNWLESQLKHGQSQTWLLQGSQFFTSFKEKSGTFESISPAELKKLGELLREENKPTLFASGDVHFSEVIDVPEELLGFQTYELTSSCLHSLTQPGLPKNDRRVTAALKENFIFVDFGKDGAMQATCYGIGEKQKFTVDISA